MQMCVNTCGARVVAAESSWASRPTSVTEVTRNAVLGNFAPQNRCQTLRHGLCMSLWVQADATRQGGSRPGAPSATHVGT